jgi:glycosyltransferase involved in cell wall biosynthesis
VSQHPRVAIVTPVFPPYRGGIGTVAAEDAAMMRARGFLVEIFTPQYAKQSALQEGVTRFQPFYAWGNAAVLFDLLKVVRGFDLVHLHYPFFGSDILTAFAAKIHRIPLVVTCHMRPKASGILGFTFRVYRFVLERFIFGAAQTVLVSSIDYAQANGIRHRSLTACPFGVDVQRFLPGDQGVARDRFGLRRDVTTIVFVGGLDDAHYFKGVTTLIEACACLKTLWQLLIVGDGSRRPIFEELAKDLGIADYIHFAGSVPFEDLPEVYRAADIHVLPSLDRSEAFGVVTLEAMATGIPSVVSNLPGVRSVIIPQETGLLVEPGSIDSLASALERLLVDSALRDRFGAAARIRAEEQFSHVKMGGRLADIYKKVISAQQ